MSLNIFLINSNHQLHQVTKAIEHFKIVNHSVIIFYFNNNQEKSIIKHFAKGKDYKIINLNNWVFKDLFRCPSKPREFFKTLNQIRNREKNINLFVSQYLNDSTLIANNILKPSTFYLMDEGTANILFSDIREKNKEGILKIKIKSLIYGKNLSFPKAITYFTKYNFKITRKSDSIIKYKEEKVNNKIDNVDEDKVFYLGCILVEMGFVDKINYLEYLNDISEMYSEKHKYYIPHRAECSLKLSEIENLGYIIKKIDIPFEIWFKSQKVIPSEISSHYYATVLGNLVDLFQNLPRIIAFSSPKLKTREDENIVHKIYLNLKSKDFIDFIKL
ncbi:hypothetical protein OAC92_00255 [Polaribacter sp.]|nr:hypothetical protein [Polaribacter sp.]